MNAGFTSEQLLDRWEDQRDVKNLMGRLSMSYCVKRERGMYEKYWSRRPDVCIGINEGWYEGSEAVAGYYMSLHENTAHQSRIVAKAFPSELEGKSEEELHGVGSMDYKPLDTAVVEIAGDRATAKGIWTIRGSHSRITDAGPVSFWEWGWFAVDFIREGDEWKIWHMQYVHDILNRQGTKLFGDIEPYPELAEFKGAGSMAEKLPNRPEKLRELYNIDRKFTPSPRVPEPYGTFCDTFSYGVEGVRP